MAPQLYWLPVVDDWRSCVRDIRERGRECMPAALALANSRLDFVQTSALDRTLQDIFAQDTQALAGPPVRLAVLGSSTVSHLHNAIRVAGLRRHLWFRTYETAYDQHMQELLNPASGLHAFKPNFVLFAFDAYMLSREFRSGALGLEDAVEAMGETLRQMWRTAKREFGCAVLQQAPLNVFPALMGSNEHRLDRSPHMFIRALSESMRRWADQEDVDLVAVGDYASKDGICNWHQPVLWARSKQEITPAASVVYGDLVARIIAARLGRSYKCLVLDLDNTLWGGVIGDDGMTGIVLAQGNPLGEGFQAFQQYALDLSKRGILLAVCSKNDEANALEPFDAHVDMILRRGDIASFVANWNDKASNIRRIAQELNIGLDSLVFVDDNPVERALVRRELPMVAVPELPDEPALFPGLLADSGYFESVAITSEDISRKSLYQDNKAREELKATATDMASYLQSLEMVLVWAHFDDQGFARILQLINKTNQFNLTTRRYSAEELGGVMTDPDQFGLQFRLIDRFGDNGIIGVVIVRIEGDTAHVDTWLMSCRVLGRDVESATLAVVVEEAKKRNVKRLVGRYIPTAKNAMVADLFPRLGFSPAADEGTARFVLDLDEHAAAKHFIEIKGEA